MSLSHKYKNFGNKSAAAEPEESMGVEAVEDEKLQSFEAGYQAGWDDAVKAQADERAKISAEFGQNLQDMSFTYHEALSKLTVSLQPVVKEIVDKLLPEIARSTLGVHIVEQLSDLINNAAEQPIEVVVAPSNASAIEQLVEGKIPSPFSIVSESSLGNGQAFVRIGSEERQIDLDAVTTGISEAMAAFFHESNQEQNNE